MRNGFSRFEAEPPFNGRGSESTHKGSPYSDPAIRKEPTFFPYKTYCRWYLVASYEFCLTHQYPILVALTYVLISVNLSGIVLTDILLKVWCASLLRAAEVAPVLLLSPR